MDNRAIFLSTNDGEYKLINSSTNETKEKKSSEISIQSSLPKMWTLGRN